MDMQVFSFSIIWTIIIDAAAWAFFHLLISLICSRVPIEFFLRTSTVFNIADWEKSGELWQRLFYVKEWKGYIPDGARLFKFGYDKRALHGFDRNPLQIFAAETKRAELAHWLSILPAPLFFLWNPAWAGWVMILYALIFNIPIIVVQRYNRARLETILVRMQRAAKA